ncbi:hypothetical protein BDP27DRAFT_1423813 [Rhodocollybia butyracea]|uniref:Uncharacterized protein n=1 Tax=Rhodocollybia butyracea TaxID=206335 RepID=A0A9P5PNL9_9AGAR|nr:hypothetical protein BDP27DRAFT_1423813 [Rhodocollybia butyracea]
MIPLVYDTVVFSLTLYRTLPSLFNHEVSWILRKLFENGIIYYSVIFTVNVILMVMILAGPVGVKNVAAQTEQLLTASHLLLSLSSNRLTSTLLGYDDVANNNQS